MHFLPRPLPKNHQSHLSTADTLGLRHGVNHIAVLALQVTSNLDWFAHLFVLTESRRWWNGADASHTGGVKPRQHQAVIDVDRHITRLPARYTRLRNTRDALDLGLRKPLSAKGFNHFRDFHAQNYTLTHSLLQQHTDSVSFDT